MVFFVFSINLKYDFYYFDTIYEKQVVDCGGLW